MGQINKIGWKTAASLVIANMVGTGVFTSLGFQVLDSQNTWSILLLWLIGGVLALVGAFVYAELGTHFKQSGGDYVFLSKTLHPSLGYLYAWISLTVGFSAPIAIAAMAMIQYWSPLIGEDSSSVMGIAAILLMGTFHSFSVRQSGTVQNVLTGIKMAFVFALIGLGMLLASAVPDVGLDFSSNWQKEILKPGFAVSLVYVFYAYTGWNSAAYIVEEIEQPSKNLPKALISGTVLVMVLYLLLQLVFLKHASIAQLSGQVQVATISFGNLFGSTGVFWVSLFIGIQLVATISGYTWVGPRITNAMAKDFRLWRPLAKTNQKGIPVRAIWFNTAIALALMFSGSFETVLLYAGFVLQLMGTLTIAASLRLPKHSGFRSPWKPWPQVIYILFSLWVMAFMLYDRPKESLLGLGIILLGYIVYLFDRKTIK
ncbi:APC family permease [Mariniradius sediminis]|uniref:APC family permease n=1 Tax=Mariniradius sediminis TaxID=2909237 RepID=A0ABS9BTX3_9BACT|nr:APC family permease [Mariniradius sediminis]MCF1750800.1 APC family permease [Mariniradius sediminis]